MEEAKCPLVGVGNENIPCLMEGCRFYNSLDGTCMFQQMSIASVEYLKELNQVRQDRELNELEIGISELNEHEKQEKIFISLSVAEKKEKMKQSKK